MLRCLKIDHNRIPLHLIHYSEPFLTIFMGYVILLPVLAQSVNILIFSKF